MRRLLLLLLVTGGLVVAAPGAAHACSCVSAGPRQYVEWADAVATARVLDVREPLGGNGLATYLLAVDGVYKGAVEERTLLQSEFSGAACGLEGIASDERHVFFMTKVQDGDDGFADMWGVPEGAWTANLCGGTGMVDEAAVQRVVGAGRAPTNRDEGATTAARPPEPGGPTRLGVSPYSYAGMGAGGLLALGAAAAWLRRVRRDAT